MLNKYNVQYTEHGKGAVVKRCNAAYYATCNIETYTKYMLPVSKENTTCQLSVDMPPGRLTISKKHSSHAKPSARDIGQSMNPVGSPPYHEHNKGLGNNNTRLREYGD